MRIGSAGPIKDRWRWGGWMRFKRISLPYPLSR